MLVRPAGGLRIFLIDEGHRQLTICILLCKTFEKGTVLLEDIRGFHETDLLRLLQEFMPDLIEVRIDFLRRDMLEILRAIDAKIDEKGITASDVESSAPLSQKALREAEEVRLDIIAHFRRPRFLHGQSEYLTELLIATLLRKADAIDAAHLIEIDELEVDAVRLVIGMLWQQSDDIREDGYHAGKARNRYALVALLHIEAPHVLVHEDRIPDALLNSRIIERRPLHRKLGLRRQQRHEITGEGLLAAMRLRAGDVGDRNLDQSDMVLCEYALRIHDIIERRQIRIASECDIPAVLTLPHVPGLRIIFDHRGPPLCSQLHPSKTHL